MKELVQLAQKVTKAVSPIVPFPISFSDKNGYLIGTTDDKRIGTFHKEYKNVVNKGEFIVYEESEVSHMDNVLPGIAMPLVFERDIIGVIGVIGSPNEVRPYAELIKRYVELTWQESFQKEITDLENKIEESYLQYILLSDSKSKTKVNEYSQLLGLDTDKRMFCIVIDIHNFLLKEVGEHTRSITVNNLKSLIIKEIRMVYKKKEKIKVHFLNAEKIVIVVSVSSTEQYFSIMSQFKGNCQKILQRMSDLDLQHANIAAGGLSDSVYTLHSSYQEAVSLLEQNIISTEKEQILSLYDWEIVTSLIPTKIDANFMNRILFELTPLTEEKQFEELKTSFIAYCENNMNITKAAEALFVHRNTLIYRLNKIERISQMDIKNFQHCSVLYMSLTSHFSNNL